MPALGQIDCRVFQGKGLNGVRDFLSGGSQDREGQLCALSQLVSPGSGPGA